MTETPGARKPLKLPVYLSPREVEEIISKIPKFRGQHRMMIILMVKCGLRVSEMLNLKIRDINIDQEELFVRQGKGAKDRLVPITWALYDIEQFVGGRQSGPMFVTSMTRTGVYKMVQRYSKAAGTTKKVTPHVFRHTFAVSYLKAGGNVMNLQTILGHARFETTAIYLKLDLKDAKEDMRRHPCPY